MYEIKSDKIELIRKLLTWAAVIISLIGIPTIMAYYAVYKYFSILENDNLNNFKLEKQRIYGISIQATEQNKYMAKHFRNKILDLSAKNFKYEDIVKWLKNEQIKLNYDFEFATMQILVDKKKNILGQKSKNILFSDDELKKLFSELMQVSPKCYNGEYETYGKYITNTRLEYVKKCFGNQLALNSFEDLKSPINPSIIWADSAKIKPPFASYVLQNCAILLIFKPNIVNSNSILKMTLKDLCKQSKNINVAFKDMQKSNKDLWIAEKDNDINNKLQKIDSFENDETEIYETDNEYISYNLVAQRFRFATIGKKIYSKNIMLIYSTIGAFFYLLFMLPFVFYTQRTIIKELPGKASIRLKLIFLLWFATGIPLIAMMILSQEHYQNKRLLQLENVQKMAKETIDNYDKKYKTYTKNLSFKLNEYFANWVKNVKEHGFNAEIYQNTHEEIYKFAKTDSVYVIATGSVIANYCGYLVYDGEIDNPIINYKKSKIERTIIPAFLEEITILNIVAKKIMSDLNRQTISNMLLAKLEFFIESVFQTNLTEITNDFMTKIRDIQLLGFYNNYQQAYFDFLSVYQPGIYDYIVICSWFYDKLQNNYIRDTISEFNRNPSGIKVVPYDNNKNAFYTEVDPPQRIAYNYLEYKNEILKDPLNDELEYVKIRNKPYALINLTALKNKGKDPIEYEKNLFIKLNCNKTDQSNRIYFENFNKIFKLCQISFDINLPFSANLRPLIIEDKEKILNKYIENLGDASAKDIEILTVGGKEYAVFSAKCQHLDCYKLVTLYPLSKIEQEINIEKTDLLLFILFSLILAISVAQLLSRSLIIPLNNLEKGVKAIEEKKYDYRIEDIGNDEFGEVSNVFNKILVGLSEVETAKIVQESLFPKENFNQNNFKIFGRSVAMRGVGGDYFDYFVTDENSFSILAGDVAGHGISAAIIMAMAKSGILCNKESQNSPKTILSLLHKLILKSKSSNQRKIMTFQYMHCNSQTGKAIYSNAGACSPFIYRKSTEEVEELKLLAPVLGGFKKSEFNEIEVNFEPGDAILFYTDGLVESRNSKGVEISYPGLKNIFKNSYNQDPAIYYKNIYKAYLKHIEGIGTQDDITLVIAVYLPSLQEETV